jgi:uncharacterized repeat protein (TIGR03803 family)
MRRLRVLSGLIVALSAGSIVASVHAGAFAARVALPDRLTQRACLSPVARLRAGDGRFVSGWCGGVLGVFDYGESRVPGTGTSVPSLLRLVSASAAPFDASTTARAPAPPAGTLVQAYFEMNGVSPVSRISYGAPGADGSLIAAPGIVPGARYRIAVYETRTATAGTAIRLLSLSRRYEARMPNALRIDSPLAGLTLAQPAHVYIELVRTLDSGAAAAAMRVPQAASHYETLHHFTGKTDGQREWGTPLLGPGGVLYGTATAGGSYGFGKIGGTASEGYGTIFEIVPPAKGQTAYATRVLHSFTGGLDGKFPYGSLIADKAGNLYGITTGAFEYQGSVFKLSPPAKGKTEWVLTTLHYFTGKGDGGSPSGDLVIDPAGNLFGTTYYGGAGCNSAGCGVVFELSPPAKGQTKWTERVLFAFDDGNNGGNPEGGLARRADGALFGMTSEGGDPNAFAGTIFALLPPARGKVFWSFDLLHTFSGRTDGGNPNAAPILDNKDALYGTTVLGGSFFEGTVFKLSPPVAGSHVWEETVLHDFGEGKDGQVPHGALVFDKAGALYGTALSGGSAGLGMAFKLTPPTAAQHSWVETELDGFAGGIFGDGPSAALVFDSAGALYGTTSGTRLEDYGTVFKITQ